MHHSRLLITGLLLSLIVGCAGSGEATVSYNDQKNVTTYETRSYTVTSISGGNFASSKSISVQAMSQCKGRDCTPEIVQLVFTADGKDELSLSGLGGKIVTDNTDVHRWNSSEAGAPTGAVTSGTSDDARIQALGKFAVVNLQVSQLRQIATASSAQGSIGGVSFDLTGSIQSGFQSMLQKIVGETEKNPSSTSP